MTYYIVGKKIKEGNLQSDSEQGILSEYFELGWEYLVSHLHIKHLFSMGQLNSDDIIVTIKDRMFLYEGFWKNVISYEDFCNITTQKSIVDLCDLIQNKQQQYLPKINTDKKYEFFESEKDVIKNIKYKNIDYLHADVPFCCLHIRYRKWASHRNLSGEFWEKVIKKIELSGLKIYVFGKEAKDFANGINIIYVGLDEYAALLNNKNCKFLIGNISGGTLVAQTFSHENCKNYVVISDKQTHDEFLIDNEYRIFYHIEEFNFSGAPICHVLTNGVGIIKDEYDFKKLMSEI